MTVQIFLVAPTDSTTDRFAIALDKALDAVPVAALFLPRGDRDPGSYKNFVRAVLPLAQDRDCAVLVDTDPELAWELAADGAHVTGGLKTVSEALSALKPDLIVGAGGITSHHDAMNKGEAGADYVFFGALDQVPASSQQTEDANWWAETFEVPCVLYEPGPETLDDFRCEFVGLGPSVWSHPEGPAKALTDISARFEVSPEPAT